MSWSECLERVLWPLGQHFWGTFLSKAHFLQKEFEGQLRGLPRNPAHSEFRQNSATWTLALGFAAEMEASHRPFPSYLHARLAAHSGGCTISSRARCKHVPQC